MSSTWLGLVRMLGCDYETLGAESERGAERVWGFIGKGTGDGIRIRHKSNRLALFAIYARPFSVNRNHGYSVY